MHLSKDASSRATPPPRNLQQGYTHDHMVVLGGGAVSYERGTPVSDGRDGRVPEGDLQAALLAALAFLLSTVFTGAHATIAPGNSSNRRLESCYWSKNQNQMTAYAHVCPGLAC